MIEPVHYRTDEGCIVALVVRRGSKWLHIIPMDSNGIAVQKIELTEERHMAPLTLSGAPYPVNRAARLFRTSGKKFGITKEAKDHLLEALRP